MQVAEMTVTLRLSNLEPLWQLSDAIQEVRSVSERLGVQEEMMPCCTALLSAAENILKSMTVEHERADEVAPSRVSEPTSVPRTTSSEPMERRGEIRLPDEGELA